MSVRSLRYNTIEQHFTKGVTASSDRDALAFLEAAQIYNANQQRAIVNLVRSLKRVGLWSKMKAIYPFVGGTATSHKWNLKDPRDVDAALRLTFAGGWTHSSTGAKPNGTSAYADTYQSILTNFDRSSAHVSFYSRTDVNRLGADIGGIILDPPFNGVLLYLRYNGNLDADIGIYGAGAGQRIRIANANSTGYYVSSRTSETLFEVHKNGSLVANNITLANTNFPEVTIYLAACHTSANAIIQYSDRECAFATIGNGLTETEATKLFNIVDLYQKRLGRAV